MCGFVRKVDFGHDFEQQLSFYVDVRGNFSNLDAVLIFLVQVGQEHFNSFHCFLQYAGLQLNISSAKTKCPVKLILT